MALPYMRIRLGGSLPGGEVWTINPAFFWGASSPEVSQDQAADWANAIGAHLGGIVPTRMRNLLSNKGTLDVIRVERYNAAGRLAFYANADSFIPLTGDGGVRLPPTTAMVTTLRTRAAGRSYRGRLYWPALGASLDTTTGRFDNAAAAGMADDMPALLAALEDDAPTGLNPVACVWSKTLQLGTTITSVDVGDVPDSQRRRKDTLRENRFTVAYPPA